MKLGLFGGTLDPPHVGHLLAASDAIEALQLERVVFIPNAAQPLKPRASAAPATDRLEMVRRLCQGDARFTCDAIEVDRGGLSFTVDTLRAYRARHPEAELVLLVGEDVAATFPHWKESSLVAELATVVVLTRDAVATTGPVGVGRRVHTRRIDVSSTEIRARVAAGQPITGFVPPAVADYIAQHGLYRGAQ